MKKVFKVLSLVLALAMVATLFGCTGTKDETTTAAGDTTVAGSDVDYSKIKVGFIFLHDENSTYDKNFMNAAKAVQAELGLKDDQVIFKTNVTEDDACLNAASDLVEAGCNLVFGDSFGFESYLVQAAEENPDVQFCHATGTNAKTSDLKNYHNAFAAIYEGRYLAGIAAGMKINEMINAGKITADKAKMGYVGAYPYAEVVSGFTSFYLGAKSVCPTVTMEVKYTNSWFDIALEKESANALIQDGCVLISQHADSEGAPKACEEAGVPNVAYNISTIDLGPTTALISSKINWEPYMKLMIENLAKGTDIPDDWCGTIATGSVELTELNAKAAAEGTQEAIDKAMAEFKAGTLHVFDTKTFTKDGAELTSYLADVVPDDKFTPDTEVIKDGYFHESDVEGMRSAPYFDIIIDGITAVTK